MFSSSMISNDRQAREAGALVAELDHAISSEQFLKSIVEGLPREVIGAVRGSLIAEKRELCSMLDAYLRAKDGDTDLLKQRAGTDLGELLIVARIAKGWTQKDLARKLGLREQAIQRYEAERYRSISLSGFQKAARALALRFVPDFQQPSNIDWIRSFELSQAEAQKILKHARTHGWLESDTPDETGFSQLVRYITEHVDVYGTPSLLRTGLNVVEHTEDWSLLSWKAQVMRRAKMVIDSEKIKYRPLSVSWLMDLVRLSAFDDGPRKAQELLLQNGIVLVVERHIPGMKVDGAAFLLDQIPVIGMTILRDTVDNFWFTLLHEVAHVILHYRTGLSAGFFDDVESAHVDELEKEANQFAENLLIPEEQWSRSTVRIAKTAEPIERFAAQLGIAPAIVFGRIRMERKNYALFSDKLGRGKVSSQFFS